MPNPSLGTVTMDVEKAIKNLKAGQVSFRVDKKGNMHGGVAKISFTEQAIYDNVVEFIRAVNKKKPSTSKGKYIKNATLSLTMSPSIKLDVVQLSEIK
jgi:large subunit ribosomal protein L1